ncbi:cyclohexadienyl dehydratase [Saccharopolyspora erythraea NRRL 2338]|uniref:Cyclohexadienyl dehydratase n=2 Tax=Saccharopolyspora erythraea TaxID=1836 RepID=A4FA50_SACEN|nr:transporter substrate-binding domain-containing protein [Saccharopolyspora erythraea]EQD83647.1 PheC [Saccharopolyspora erythraea D]PFG94712.1 cyclohexadienyl dehydratase [Saccharopolyspora erythraea NRRL 2338]QRK91436.1 transporter substrate-binding domain-containing protein [Saccharopolyspora erythraea]CAM00925.1 cyclohexadienyl dehydratase [Saccharopolyspora erythraea NRRL 2338]
MDRKTLALGLALALVAVIAVGTTWFALSRPSATPAPPAPNRLEQVAQRGELRVCSTGDYRPFTYRDASGAWSGIDIDMAHDLAARLGVRATIVPTTWKTLMRDFRQRCDIAVGGVSITLERAKQAAFSRAYVVDGKTPITRCENAERFGTLEQIDQPGVRAIVNPGGTNEQFARQNLKRATIVEHPDNNTIFEQVIAGHADLMMTDAAETKWQAKQHPELCAVHPDQPFTFSEKAYLLPLGDVVFQQWVDQWLNLALHDGTYARIARPWIG